MSLEEIAMEKMSQCWTDFEAMPIDSKIGFVSTDGVYTLLVKLLHESDSSSGIWLFCEHPGFKDKEPVFFRFDVKHDFMHQTKNGAQFYTLQGRVEAQETMDFLAEQKEPIKEAFAKEEFEMLSLSSGQFYLQKAQNWIQKPEHLRV